MSAQPVSVNGKASETGTAKARKLMEDAPEVQEGDEEEVDDEDEETIDLDDEKAQAASTSLTAKDEQDGSKKKKKKKSKGGKGQGKAAVERMKRALNLGRNGVSSSNSVDAEAETNEMAPISDELYERIINEARKNVGPEEAAKLNRQSVMEMVESLRLRDVITGKSSGIDSTGRNMKDMSDYKFWSTQPVPKLGSLSNITPNGPLETDKLPEEIRQDPYPLPKDFEWVTMDINDSVQLKEVYELLTLNYVEDGDATFRFDYSAEFLRWVLQPPGFIQDWHIGVRVIASRRLVAFISGIPITLRIRQAVQRCSEINFLCVHKKLRSKRLAPVLIKEVTRRCNSMGIFQAIYTAGVFLPTPFSACQYYHRALNTKKLVETGFVGVPRSTSLARMIAKNKVADSKTIPSLREIEESDITQVGDLLRAYLARFDISPVMTEEDMRQNFYSGKGVGPVNTLTGRREGQVTWTYVVEDPESHRITDFFSFYTLPSTAIRTTPQQTINAAYLFYYATSSCSSCEALLSNGKAQGTSEVITWEKESPVERKKLKERLNILMTDALVIAHEAKFDVFNALTLQDNNLFLETQKFGAGDGFLHFYLYNWATRPIAGGCVEPAMAAAGLRSHPKGQPSGGFIPEKGSGIGVVML